MQFLWAIYQILKLFDILNLTILNCQVYYIHLQKLISSWKNILTIFIVHFPCIIHWFQTIDLFLSSNLRSLNFFLDSWNWWVDSWSWLLGSSQILLSFLDSWFWCNNFLLRKLCMIMIMFCLWSLIFTIVNVPFYSMSIIFMECLFTYMIQFVLIKCFNWIIC